MCVCIYIYIYIYRGKGEPRCYFASLLVIFWFIASVKFAAYSRMTRSDQTVFKSIHSFSHVLHKLRAKKRAISSGRARFCGTKSDATRLVDKKNYHRRSYAHKKNRLTNDLHLLPNVAGWARSACQQPVRPSPHPMCVIDSSSPHQTNNTLIYDVERTQPPPAGRVYCLLKTKQRSVLF